MNDTYTIKQDSQTGQWHVVDRLGMAALGPIIRKEEAEKAAARLNKKK